MFKQVCLLALLAGVVVGRRVPQPRTDYIERTEPRYSNGGGTARGLLPPYVLKKTFGTNPALLKYKVNTTAIITEYLCDDMFDLPALNCEYPDVVHVTVHDWQPVRDIVVPKPLDYRHIKVLRNLPCNGQSVVEIYAICAL